MSSGFVSETDLAERRRVRKEMWQRTRRDSDPEEPPEEEIPDHRSLYERLQEQKDKKQEEWEEAHKLKNMVRGLEDDEVDFLELVDNTKIQEEKRIKAEENSALQEYRKKVSEMQQKAIETEVTAELKPDVRKSSGETKKSSQLSLLAGAIKKKRTSSETDNESPRKSLKVSEKGMASVANDSPSKESRRFTAYNSSSAIQCVAVLPGLGVYTDSSDSDDSDSDSDLESRNKDLIPRDIMGRVIQFPASAGGKGCC